MTTVQEVEEGKDAILECIRNAVSAFGMADIVAEEDDKMVMVNFSDTDVDYSISVMSL